jgi:hypothetical protein
MHGSRAAVDHECRKSSSEGEGPDEAISNQASESLFRPESEMCVA